MHIADRFPRDAKSNWMTREERAKVIKYVGNLLSGDSLCLARNKAGISEYKYRHMRREFKVMKYLAKRYGQQCKKYIGC